MKENLKKIGGNLITIIQNPSAASIIGMSACLIAGAGALPAAGFGIVCGILDTVIIGVKDKPKVIELSTNLESVKNQGSVVSVLSLITETQKIVYLLTKQEQSESRAFKGLLILTGVTLIYLSSTLIEREPNPFWTISPLSISKELFHAFLPWITSGSGLFLIFKFNSFDKENKFEFNPIQLSDKVTTFFNESVKAIQHNFTPAITYQHKTR